MGEEEREGEGHRGVVRGREKREREEGGGGGGQRE